MMNEREVMDKLLRRLANEGRIYYEDLPNNYLQDNHEIVSFLTKERYINQMYSYLEITTKGRMLINDGGFSAELRQRRNALVLQVATFVVALLAFLVAVIQLYVSLRSESADDGVEIREFRIIHDSNVV